MAILYLVLVFLQNIVVRCTIQLILEFKESFTHTIFSLKLLFSVLILMLKSGEKKPDFDPHRKQNF